MIINLVLRGHVRTCFDNTHLNDIITKLKEKHEIHIYINTWSDNECKKSWRAKHTLLQTQAKIVPEHLTTYFKGNTDLIKELKINEEDDTLLIGDILGFNKTQGGLSEKCRMPKRGWKLFVLNCYESLQLIPKNNRTYLTICMRLDMFSLPLLTKNWPDFTNNNLTTVEARFKHINNMINTYDSLDKRKKLRTMGAPYWGYDNALIGQYLPLHDGFEYLHKNLDEILREYTKWCPGQENLTRYAMNKFL